MDFGVSGQESEPSRGYRCDAERERQLEAFCRAAWQQQTRRHAHRQHVEPWPRRESFHANWPLLAFDLTVARWKISSARVDHDGEADAELLDPVPEPEVGWRDRFAAELEACPVLAFDLRAGQPPGDGLKRVLERAGLRPGERAVARGVLYGSTPAEVADELAWRPQTCTLLWRKAVDRLQHLAKLTTRRAPNRFRV